MSPNEYYDGKAWQPIPSGFTGGTNELRLHLSIR